MMKFFALVNKRRLTAACLPLIALLFFGCVHPHLPPIADLSVNELDMRCLEGKVIVIDPGHGGPERGAIGVRGVTEAEINLTVALHLWGLLKQAGAQPMLTRLSDQALHAAQEFDLPTDLALRNQAGRDAKADLFVSIHHNASLNRTRNNLIIFYAMADPFRSRDAARSIGAALQHSLDRDSHSVQAGNYKILRSTGYPAILGEASFISNKKNELALAYTRTLAAEARGYFNGILDYFSRGTPSVQNLYASSSDASNARPPIQARLDSGCEQGLIDPHSITAKIDQKPVKNIEVKQNYIKFVPPELLNGKHRVCVAFRNTLGNSARNCINVDISLPPHSLAITSGFSVIPPNPHAVTAIDIDVRDRLGRPVLDGTPITLSSSIGTLVRADGHTTNGHANAMLAAEETPGTAILTAISGNVRAGTTVKFAKTDKALLTLTIRNPGGQPVNEAALVTADQALAYSNRYGYVQVETAQKSLRHVQIIRQGYEPYSLSLQTVAGSITTKNIVLQPIDEGLFFEKTIMLDPEGLCPETIPVLQELQDKIEHAGGRAPLTWSNDPAPSYSKRVLISAAEKADVFLSIGGKQRRCSAGYYHRSSAGLELAELIQKTFDEHGLTGWRKCSVRHSTHAAVLHTSMPALELALPEKFIRKSPETVAQALYEALQQWLQKRSNLKN